jgi:hypothetical protein
MLYYEEFKSSLGIRFLCDKAKKSDFFISSIIYHNFLMKKIHFIFMNFLLFKIPSSLNIFQCLLLASIMDLFIYLLFLY